MIRSTGMAKLRSICTGEVFTVEGESLDWQLSGSEERGMGTENWYSAEVEFNANDGTKVSCVWNVWEYPIGMENMTRTDAGDGTEIDDDLSYGLDPDQDSRPD